LTKRDILKIDDSGEILKVVWTKVSEIRKSHDALPSERESETTEWTGRTEDPRITKNVDTTAASNSTITILIKSATIKSRYGGFIGENTR